MRHRAMLLLPLAALLAAAAPSDKGEELRDAAREGDLARVRALLDAGAPPDAAKPDGVTALLHAAEKGNVEIVTLLLDRGADVNARERFFHSTALGLALSAGKLDLARLLLARGATDATDALEAAVERDDADLARTALATGKVGRIDLMTVRKQAAGKGAALTEVLASASLPGPAPTVPMTPAALQKFAGRYRGQAGEITVSVKGEGLAFAKEGSPDLVLRPTGPTRFEDEQSNSGALFWGRGDTVESLTISREGDVAGFRPAAGADPTDLPQASAPALEVAPRGEARPWPAFRGADAGGNGDGQGAPAAWSVAEGKNIRFRTPIPGLALSSPIAWGGRIFLTTAVSSKGDTSIRTGLYGDPGSVDDLSEHSFRLLAIDAADGKIRWEREVAKGIPAIKRHLKASQANATPVTDGKRVVALFGSAGVLAAYDVDGNPLWKVDVGPLASVDPIFGSSEWGHASSPILYGDLVIVLADRRKDSFLAAYRVATGEQAWRTARDEPSTWGSPNVLRSASGDELVTNGKKIRGYDPKTGALLWSLGPNSETIVATPVVGDGFAFITGGYPPVRPIYAVRAGGKGDLSLAEGKTAGGAVAWSHGRGGTYLPTPILYRGLLYLLNNNGVLACYRAATGEQLYQMRVGANNSFTASPVAADGRLYLASETGEVYVLRAGEKAELLATNAMDEVVMATPAISDGLLLVRTTGHLVGIAAPAGP